MTDLRLSGGLRGRPLAFFFVETASLDSDGMCNDKFGFASAHLCYVVSASFIAAIGLAE